MIRAAKFVAWNKPQLLGATIFGCIVLFAIFAPEVLKTDPLKVNVSIALVPPSAAHPFGTDNFGRDILARTAAGARLDLSIAFLVVLFAASAGTILGVVAGSSPTWLDQVIMRCTDVVLSFPAILLAMVIVAVLGNSVAVVVVAVALAYTPYFVRVTRSRVLSQRTSEYVDAAVVMGNPSWRIALLHILPNSLSPSLVQAALAFGWSILDTAGLAFLAVGIIPPTPEWGLMIGEGTRDILGGVWWTSAFPGAFIFLTALGANLLGSSLGVTIRR